jgi:quinol-cytochrome oxidoreductase complex cytochrome b subunit
VDNATLNRFFSLHYLLPFVIAAVSILHLALLHMYGSSNPLALYHSSEKITFHPYFTLKDLFGFIGFLVIFAFLIFYKPNLLGHPDNYIYANPLVTPLHIVPEWYFLPFYAILRACPNKIGGIILMGMAIVILLALP